MDDDCSELTPQDRAGFVRRIASVSPYDEGQDASGRVVCPEDFITDLLTDIRHYCDSEGLDFAACDRCAHQHYVREREAKEEGRPCSKTPT